MRQTEVRRACIKSRARIRSSSPTRSPKARGGVRRRPSANIFPTKGGSCALGAAYEGAYALPATEKPHSIRPRLDRLFDCLENVRRRCPEGCNKRLPLNAIILHLNDDHHWTREQIVELAEVDS